MFLVKIFQKIGLFSIFVQLFQDHNLHQILIFRKLLRIIDSFQRWQHRIYSTYLLGWWMAVEINYWNLRPCIEIFSRKFTIQIYIYKIYYIQSLTQIKFKTLCVRAHRKGYGPIRLSTQNKCDNFFDPFLKKRRVWRAKTCPLLFLIQALAVGLEHFSNKQSV